MMRLALLTPDSARSLRVRVNCVHQLQRTRRRSERWAAAAYVGRLIVAPAAALAGAAYLVNQAGLALQTLARIM